MPPSGANVGATGALLSSQPCRTSMCWFATTDESITPRFRPLDDPDHDWQGRRHLSRGRGKEAPMGRILLAGFVGGAWRAAGGTILVLVLAVGDPAPASGVPAAADSTARPGGHMGHEGHV